MRRTNLTYLLIIFMTIFLSVGQDTFAQGGSDIFSPGDFEVVSGAVTLRGTANDGDFARYEIAYLQAANPGAGWIVFATGNSPVINGTLGTWDTTQGQNLGLPVFPDGAYQLRMRVVRSNQSFSEHFVNRVEVDNSALQPADTPDPNSTPTVDPAASGTPTPFATPIPTSTPFQTRVAPTSIPEEDVASPEPQPDILPSLTPISIPTPTENEDGFVTDDATLDELPTSVDSTLDSVLNFDFGMIREGFRTGAMWTFGIVALIGIYTLLRNFLRWIWRTVSDTNF